MSHWKRFPSKVWLVIPVLSLVLLAVACGAAATATPAPVKAPTAAQPAAPAAQPAVPAAPAAAAPAPKAAPTPAPTLAAAVTPAARVHPGKLTIMVGDLGNQRFDYAFATGSGARNYLRIMGGYLISDNEKRESLPGIASRWSLSADGLTWTFTIRKGVKFHDGSELTP